MQSHRERDTPESAAGGFPEPGFWQKNFALPAFGSSCRPSTWPAHRERQTISRTSTATETSRMSQGRSRLRPVEEIRSRRLAVTEVRPYTDNGNIACLQHLRVHLGNTAAIGVRYRSRVQCSKHRGPVPAPGTWVQGRKYPGFREIEPVWSRRCGPAEFILG